MSETDASETVEKIEMDTDNDNDNDNDNDTDTVEKGKRVKSAVWNYFEIVNPASKIAMCNICSKRLVYSTLYNLKRHLGNAHGVNSAGDPIKVQDKRTQSTNSYRRSSPIWEFFTREAGDRAECKICCRWIHHSNGTSNLKRHVRLRHPDEYTKLNVTKKIIIHNNQAFEIENDGKEELDEENLIEMNAVYLDEYIEEVAKKQNAKKPRLNNSSLNRQSISHQSIDQPTNDQSTTHQLTIDASALNNFQISTNKSLDFFAKYLLSLLEKLPEAVSVKLQSQFLVKTLSEMTEHCAEEKVSSAVVTEEAIKTVPTATEQDCTNENNIDKNKE